MIDSSLKMPADLRTIPMSKLKLADSGARHFGLKFRPVVLSHFNIE